MNEQRLFGRRVPIRLKWLVLGWLGAEVAVFALLVQALGFGTTVLLGLATTVLGVLVLRRLGSEALLNLRRAVEGRQPAEGALLDGMLSALGALLLILPGFLANFAGLALAAPSVRRKVLHRYGGVQGLGPTRLRRSSPDVLDLGPTDWRPVDGP